MPYRSRNNSWSEGDRINSAADHGLVKRHFVFRVVADRIVLGHHFGPAEVLA
jgi:hypothetical protein